MKGRWRTVVAVWAALMMSLPLIAGAQEMETVRVGVYQNRPGVFIDEKGVTRGFYIDILEEIARRENWKPLYVPGTWSENMLQLNQGHIDLLVAIAFTEAREKKFDFSRETILANWGQLYVRDPKIQSLLDLKDRRIVGMKDDIYTSGLQSLLDRFDVEAVVQTVPEYAKVLQQVASGRADAGIVSRIFGLQNDQSYDIRRSTVVCCPVEIRFAAPNGRYDRHLRAIDTHLDKMKVERGSFYFRSLNKWFGISGRREFPAWLIWLGMFGVAVVVVSFLVTLYLRQEVARRTSALREEIAERQRIDKKLKESYSAIEKKARDLEDARLAAELANKAKSEFLANVTHELRTPMNAIRGMTELTLQLEDLPPKAREFLTHVYASSRSLMKIIDDILNFSRAGRGHTKLEAHSFDLADVFRHLLDFSKSAAGYKRIGMVMTLPREVPRNLVGDVNKLGRILTHLVDNALKFTEKGGIRVQAYLVEQEEQRVQLRFQVHDTGIGITREQMPHIFESFVQGDGSSTRRHGGTGIGLALCKSLVEMMGGEIWVESVPEKGSTFCFTAWFERGAKAPGKVEPLTLNTPRVPSVDGKPVGGEQQGEVPPASKPVKLEEKHVQRLQELANALYQGDVAKAESDFDKVRSEMAMLVSRGALRTLAEQVDDFDFHEAQKTLFAIADSLGVQLEGEAG